MEGEGQGEGEGEGEGKAGEAEVEEMEEEEMERESSIHRLMVPLLLLPKEVHLRRDVGTKGLKRKPFPPGLQGARSIQQPVRVKRGTSGPPPPRP